MRTITCKDEVLMAQYIEANNELKGLFARSRSMLIRNIA